MSHNETKVKAAQHQLLADALVALPDEIETPSHANAWTTRSRPEIQWLMFGDEGDQRARAAAIVSALGGKWDKSETGKHFRFKQNRDGVDFEIVVDREQVCTARVVGTETVTKQVPVQFEEITETVDVIEWDCAPLLGEKREAAAAQVGAV